VKLSVKESAPEAEDEGSPPEEEEKQHIVLVAAVPLKAVETLRTLEFINSGGRASSRKRRHFSNGQMGVCLRAFFF